MAAVTAAILSEREGGQVVLRVQDANVDGEVATVISLPTGFGDCYIVRVAVTAQDIATMMTSPELNGPLIYLATPAGSSHDVWWSSRWDRTAAARLAALADPLLAVLWRDSETLTISAAEVDTNASPTADITVWILVQRRRNMGPSVGPGGPLQFTS